MRLQSPQLPQSRVDYQSQQQLRCSPRSSPWLSPRAPATRGVVNSKKYFVQLKKLKLLCDLAAGKLFAHLDCAYRALFTYPGLLRLGTLLLVFYCWGLGPMAVDSQAKILAPGRALPSFQVNDRRPFFQGEPVQAATQALPGSSLQPPVARFLLCSAEARSKVWSVKVNNFFGNRGFEFATKFFPFFLFTAC